MRSIFRKEQCCPCGDPWVYFYGCPDCERKIFVCYYCGETAFEGLVSVHIATHADKEDH